MPKTGNLRVRGRRRRGPDAARPAQRFEPATFAWVEPLADVDPVVVEREIITERNVDRPVYVDRMVEVEKLVEVEKIIEVARPVEKIVEREVFIDRPFEVEKIVEVEVEKIVEKPVIVEKEVFVDKEVVVEKEVFVDRPVPAVAAAVTTADAATKVKKKSQQKLPKAIIVGRGPSLATRIGRVMPQRMPVLAGAASLLAVISAMALMSPSGDNASAERGKSVARANGGATIVPTLKIDGAEGNMRGKSRDPFAAESYRAPEPTSATAAAVATKKATAKAKAVQAAAATRAGAPAAVATSMYTAKLTTYSSYTPWTKARKRAGGWIDFDSKPTVKVLSVGKSSAVLFVVTDVEVIKEKSAHSSYNKPIRQVKLAKGGVVRFADYRDIQGDDVTYTIRYDGSEKIKLAAVAK
ncbi:MAG: hypothetical protein ACSLFF_11200 [Solirubrobacterales bacterium]